MVAIRVTPADHVAWREKAAAAGVSPSALLREPMVRTQTWTAPALAVESERIRQIARIGNNLNQLARWANTHKEAVEAVEVIGHLIAIRREMALPVALGVLAERVGRAGIALTLTVGSVRRGALPICI